MSILSTNTSLIKVGKDYSAGSGISIDDNVISVTGELGNTYSAGDNISIYEQGEQLYISSKDWTNDIANASANAYNEAVAQIPDPFDPSFISGQVDNKLDTTAFTNWQNGQYSTDLQTIEGQISNKLDETAFSQVSGDFLTAAPADMATTGDVAELEQTISETYQVKGNYVTVEGVESSTSGKSDTSATVYYESKPSSNPIYASGNDLNNVYSIQGTGSNLAIIPSNVLHVPNVITAAPNAVLQVKDVITAATNGVLQVKDVITVSPSYVLQVPNVITAAPYSVLSVSNVITANPGGIIAHGFSAQKDYGLTANGITAGKRGPLCIQGNSESISSVNGAGFTFSSQNTNFGTAQLTTANSNQFVKIPSPKFEARNISGAGFSIEASGAKGYDESGNVVWDTTKPAKLIGWSNYQGTAIDQRADGIDGGIIATVLPDYIPNTMSISSSPYTYMNGIGFYKQIPGVISSTFDDNGFIYQHIQSKITASMGYGDVKYEKYNNNTSSTDTWSLTGSVQKREIEYDADTSAITAIAGSALAGGGDVPTGTMNVSGLEYNAVNEISAYNGSAIAQYGAEKQWLQHDDTLVHASNSAQYALGCNVSALQRLMGIDETVLWSGSATNISSFTVSEPLTNFKEVAFYVTPSLDIRTYPVKVTIPIIGRNTEHLDISFNTTWDGFSGINFSYSFNQTGMSSFNVSTGRWFGYKANGATAGLINYNLFGYKIVGIGRKA